MSHEGTIAATDPRTLAAVDQSRSRPGETRTHSWCCSLRFVRDDARTVATRCQTRGRLTVNFHFTSWRRPRVPAISGYRRSHCLGARGRYPHVWRRSVVKLVREFRQIDISREGKSRDSSRRERSGFRARGIRRDRI